MREKTRPQLEKADSLFPIPYSLLPTPCLSNLGTLKSFLPRLVTLKTYLTRLGTTIFTHHAL